MPILKAPEHPDETYIRTMFDQFAARYDIFSWLIGVGQAGRMRRLTLSEINPGMKVLDLASGTGDLAVACALRVGPGGEITALDFSSPMLEIAHKKFLRRTTPGQRPFFETVCASAQELPLPGKQFDWVVSGYALRNLYQFIGSILDGVYHSLKPGGQIAFLDLTEPPDPIRRLLFRGYFYFFVGIYGAVLFGKNYPISYLPDSANRFFRAKEFCEALKNVGFQKIRSKSLMLGAVTLYTAERPS